MHLDTHISLVAGVGPKISAILKKLQIVTVRDLVYYFPFRYEDLTKNSTIYECKQGEENTLFTVQASLDSIDNIFTKFGKKITKGVISDETDKMEVIWFNKHFIKKTLSVGEKYRFSGKISRFGNKVTLTAPVVNPFEENSLTATRLVPIYPETKGITSKWLATKIHYVLERIHPIEDLIPKEVLTRQNLTGINTCIENIHFPKNTEHAKLARKRFAFEELFLELLAVEERKTSWEQANNGVRLEHKREQVEGFVSSLPFELTFSQKKAIDEIIQDLGREHPMNRLLEGDVGTGKTIVAIVTAYVAYINGHKTLYMAPTEILANQHFETFKSFLEKVDPKIKIVLKTGTKRTKLEDTFDIAIGTHALLYTEKQLQNLGLVVIDEQHRFGVEQRAKIMTLNNMNEKNERPNLLTMTATPIPRTLALTLYGDLQISVLDAPPNKDKKITTFVIPQKQREKAYETIKTMGEPTFVVCPFISESESEMFENVRAAEAEFLSLKEGVFKDETIGLLHGKMRPAQKEQIIKDFRVGKIKVLVSTPVIEVGIDIPDATIIVIESAERYGLASLHQLRGRVGRGTKEGFCFLIPSNFSRDSFMRLKHMERETNGLKLAEIDLKMRGQGDVFGKEQSGFKAFKVADISDIELLEKARTEAQIIYKKLNEYPLVREHVKNSKLLVEKN